MTVTEAPTLLGTYSVADCWQAPWTEETIEIITAGQAV
jgi:hypothetical protein